MKPKLATTPPNNESPENQLLKSLLKRRASRVLPIALATVSLAASQAVMAAAFNPFIQISATAEFDSFGAPRQPTRAGQNGSLSLIQGGNSISSTLLGATVTGPDPLSGALTDIGDGVGVTLNASGDSREGLSSVNTLFGDFNLSIKNTSPFDTFLISLSFEFSHQVEASETAPSDDNGDFAHSTLQLQTSDNSELLFSKLISDTVFGNEQRLSTAPDDNIGKGSGGKLSDSGSRLLTFILHPGDLLSLGNDSPELTLFGEANSGAFSATSSAFISVADVTRQNATVPEPETLALLAIGLAACSASRHRLAPHAAKI